MPESKKHKAQPDATDSSAQPRKDDNSEFDRAPRQKSQDRDAVKICRADPAYPHQTRRDQITFDRSLLVSGSATDLGCPTSRSFFARCGIPPR